MVRVGYAPEVLKTGAWVGRFEVAPGAPEGAGAVLAYATLRAARIERRSVAVLAPETDFRLLSKFLPLRELPLLAPIHAVRTAEALSALGAACARNGEPLQPELLVGEVVASVKAFVARFRSSGFCRAVDQGTLAREQYVHMLEQTHQYVRYTTRILGACIADSADSELREHFIGHLSGEVNHELIIERDLLHLSADVAHAREGACASPATLQFLLSELALISALHDPVLLCAAPLAAEGMSAHLDRAFIDRLNALVGRWGVAAPASATRFLASHIDFDSGSDGHWEGSVKLLRRNILTEPQLARFLAALGACTDALERCYQQAMDDLSLFALPAQDAAQ